MGPFLLSFVALSLLTSALTAQSRMAEQSPIIAMHLHAVPEGQGRSLDEMLHDMETHGIARAVLIVRDTLTGMQWRARAPERFLLSPALPCYEGRSAQGDPCFESEAGWPDLEWLKHQYVSGRMKAMGEILYVYYGMPPTDERLEPYWALAEEMGIPVGAAPARRFQRDVVPTTTTTTVTRLSWNRCFSGIPGSASGSCMPADATS